MSWFRLTFKPKGFLRKILILSRSHGVAFCFGNRNVVHSVHFFIFCFFDVLESSFHLSAMPLLQENAFPLLEFLLWGQITCNLSLQCKILFFSLLQIGEGTLSWYLRPLASILDIFVICDRVWLQVVQWRICNRVFEFHTALSFHFLLFSLDF